MKKIIVAILESIIWFFRPRILRVDHDTAKYLTTYGGGRLIVPTPPAKEGI